MVIVLAASTKKVALVGLSSDVVYVSPSVELFTKESMDICANDKIFIIQQRYYHQEQNSGLIDI